MKTAMLIDTSKCLGCRACQVACKQWNDLPAEDTRNGGTYQNPPDLSADTLTMVRFREVERADRVDWLMYPWRCMHCTEAACVTACPTGALFHDSRGFVRLDASRCTGCGYCAMFCPFNVPRLRADTLSGGGKMSKCTFCQDRVHNGELPACAKTCPSGAIQFGDRDELVATGLARAEVLNTDGFPQASLYGQDILGGLGVMYVLTDDPEVYGLPAEPRMPPMIYLWRKVTRPLGGIAVGAAALGLAVNFFIARRRIRAEEVAHD